MSLPRSSRVSAQRVMRSKGSRKGCENFLGRREEGTQTRPDVEAGAGQKRKMKGRTRGPET